ncbi:hypothetical protein [Clostridium lacusfryxellense]|nr:hypothetical protein [Clostridium lacusfryxellense]
MNLIIAETREYNPEDIIKFIKEYYSWKDVVDECLDELERMHI